MISTTTESSDSTFYLSPFCCICLENTNLYPLNTCENGNISYACQLAYCFPEKETKHNKDVMRYICKDCTLMVTLTVKFKQLYYKNVSVTEKYLQEFRKLNKNKLTNISVNLLDIKQFLSLENTVKVEVYEPTQEINLVKSNSDEIGNSNEIEIKTEELEQKEEEIEDKFLGFSSSTTISCTTCNISKENKQIHLNNLVYSRQTSKKQYECQDCNKVYTTLKSLKNHKQIHKVRYPCEFCKAKFIHFANFKQHLKNHNPQLQCPICQKLLTTSYYLHQHLKTHNYKAKKCRKCNQIKLPKHICQTVECQNSNTTTNDVQHNCVAKTTTKCQVCNKQVQDGAQHACISVETCWKCNQIIKDTNIRHVCKKFKCLLCPKEFLKRPYLNNHLRAHIFPKKNKCTYCYKKFHKLGLLRRHLKQHFKVY